MGCYISLILGETVLHVIYKLLPVSLQIIHYSNCELIQNVLVMQLCEKSLLEMPSFLLGYVIKLLSSLHSLGCCEGRRGGVFVFVLTIMFPHRLSIT